MYNKKGQWNYIIAFIIAVILLIIIAYLFKTYA